MKTRTVTRTLVLVALMLNLGVAAVYAQQKHVKMTFSGTMLATTINLQPDTVTDEGISPGTVRSDRSPFVNYTLTI